MKNNEVIINIAKLNDVGKDVPIGRMLEILFRTLQYVNDENTLFSNQEILTIPRLSKLLDIEEQAVRRCINLMYKLNIAKKIYISSNKTIMFNPNIVRKVGSNLELLLALYERKNIPNKIKSRSCEKWHELVLERDNYTCQCCGSHDNLEAHHVLNYSTNKDLRHDVNNGITLCERCHNPMIAGSFHNIYGIRNNTREQLEEYIVKYKDFQKIILSLKLK